MIIKITNKCTMNCIHCFENSTPDNKDMMSVRTLEKILMFIKSNDMKPKVILISGGEPTEHPDLTWFIQKLSMQFDMIILLTNGLWLNESSSYQMIKSLSRFKKLMIQIISDPNLYPKEIDYGKVYNKKQFMVMKDVPSIIWKGRALENKNKIPSTYQERESPLCFNFRSLVNGRFNVSTAFNTLENSNKFCSLSFDTNGFIRISETIACPIVGSVDSDMSTIKENILKMNCSDCYLQNNLSTIERKSLNL